mgnify:CR=1 FL=1
MNYNNEIPTPPVLVEGTYGVSKKVKKVTNCGYCNKQTDQFNTLAFRKNTVKKAIICGECMNHIRM